MVIEPFTLWGVDVLLFYPSGLLTLKELDYVNLNKSQTTIRQHLQWLADAGIVEEVLSLRITDDRRWFLKDYKLLQATDTLREIYDRVEKTNKIKRYETALRPKH